MGRWTKVIGFRAKKPMNYLMFEPVHRRLAVDARLDFRFYGELWGRKRDAAKLYEEAGAGPIRLMPDLVARYYPFDLYVSANLSVAARWPRKSAHIFHGVSFKNHSISVGARRYDAIFVVGPYMERQFVNWGILPEGDPRMRRVGMPKLDRMVDGSLDREAILAGLGCRPDRPTVLYAPTWGPESSLDPMGEEVIRRLCGIGLNLVVKLHDNSFDPRNTRIPWREKLVELAHPDLKVPVTHDVVPLLSAADLLISDASSVSYEYLLMDRPIIFLKFPGQLDRPVHPDEETWGRKVGFTLEDARQIGPTIERALADSAIHHEIRQQAAQDLFFHPGHATDRAVAEVYDLLELEPLRVSGSPPRSTPTLPRLGSVSSPRKVVQWPLEFVPCYDCGSDDHDLLLVASGYRIVQCRRCGLMFTNPRVAQEALASLYAMSPEDIESRETRTDPYRVNTFRWFLDTLEPLRRGNRILEVGPGTGVFLKMARERGWGVCGLDISSDVVERLRAEMGLEVVRGSPGDDLPLEPASFDVVVGCHVIEHLYEPAKAFRGIQALLRPGGCALFKLPDARGILLRTEGGWRPAATSSAPGGTESDRPAVGGNWLCRHLPHWLYRRYVSRYYRPLAHLHTVHYTPATLSRMLEGAGLTPVRVFTDFALNEFPARKHASRLGYWFFGKLGCPFYFAMLARKD